ncbi:MAG: hypothetical protein KDD83_11420 [Caldilineaceae bacterium]|nr:hypothetical protein [Caldilineaceae bacterium]
MLRTTVVGSWPPEARFYGSLEHFHRGKFAAPEPLLRTVAQAAIAQQCACGLDEYTGGETSADTFILHFPAGFTGLERTENHEAWGGRGTYRVIGAVDAPQGLGIAAAYARERALDPAIEKVTIPGPSELVMRIESETDRLTLRPTMIRLIRREIDACVALGARDIQLDVPHIAMGLADGRGGWTPATAAATIRAVFDGYAGFRRSVHFCYGDFDAKTWTENHAFAPLVPLIQALDGVIDRVVLEFSLPEQWAERRLLAELPASMEIAAGIVDVKSPDVESRTALVQKIYALLEYVPPERLLICPSCGLGRRTVELAVAKATVMVEAVQQVNAELAQV